MVIYPAIDIRAGRCVRLQQGRMDSATDYGAPGEMARKWRDAGAQWLHVVDLDAAFSGGFVNREAVSQILKAVDIPVQLGGGVRTMADIEERLEALGVARVVLGTAAHENPELLRAALRKYPGRVAAGIDASEGRVALRGWAKETETSPVELGLRMRDAGVRTIIYTDIARDGMLAGPNLAMTRRMIEETGIDIVASGGVGTMDDVLAVKDTGAAGVIIGRALYTGGVGLTEAIKTIKN